jgi:hypothetical protein
MTRDGHVVVLCVLCSTNAVVCRPSVVVGRIDSEDRCWLVDDVLMTYIDLEGHITDAQSCRHDGLDIVGRLKSTVQYSTIKNSIPLVTVSASAFV